MMACHRRMLPSSFVNPVIGRAFAVRADAEQRAEGVERVEPAIEPEGKFVEVGLQMLRADPVVASGQPAFQGTRRKRRHPGTAFGSWAGTGGTADVPI